MSSGPPAHLKKKREEVIKRDTSDLPFEEALAPVSRGPRPTPRGEPSLSKIARHGIPPAPPRDFPLPAARLLRGTVGQRVKTLVRSIRRPIFLCEIRSTGFFEIKMESTLMAKDGSSTLIHFGEIYTVHKVGIDSYTNNPTTAHAWIILTHGGVWQFHFVHSASEYEEIPTFLMSMENYLMYMHLRIGQPLPSSIFDADEDLRAWAGKMYDDVENPPTPYQDSCTSDADPAG